MGWDVGKYEPGPQCAPFDFELLSKGFAMLVERSQPTCRCGRPTVDCEWPDCQKSRPDAEVNHAGPARAASSGAAGAQVEADR